MKTILLADDEPDVREILSYNLVKRGYRVIEARNGAEACALAMEFQPDLIVLDLMMPEMNGFDACRKIREVKELQLVYIVFFSALNENLALTAGHHVFVDDYIPKSVGVSEFLARISRLLNA